MPVDASTAYLLFSDKHGTLAPTGTLASVARDVRAAMLQGPSAQQTASAQAMAKQYNTPQAQAALQNMSLAEKMAFAQKMQAQMGTASVAPRGPASAHDIALVKDVSPYADTGLQQKIVNLRGVQMKLDREWQKADAAIEAKEQAAIHAIATCPEDKTGSSLPVAQLRSVELSYADQRIAAAKSWLGRMAPYRVQMLALVKPAVQHGDRAMASWSQIQDASLKGRFRSAADVAWKNGLMNVNDVLGTVQVPAEHAAQAVADRHAVERRFAKLSGCTTLQ